MWKISIFATPINLVDNYRIEWPARKNLPRCVHYETRYLIGVLFFLFFLSLFCRKQERFKMSLSFAPQSLSAIKGSFRQNQIIFFLSVKTKPNNSTSQTACKLYSKQIISNEMVHKNNKKKKEKKVGNSETGAHRIRKTKALCSWREVNTIFWTYTSDNGLLIKRQSFSQTNHPTQNNMKCCK